MSHVRCRCGFVFPIVDGRGLCPRCVSLTPPATRDELEPAQDTED